MSEQEPLLLSPQDDDAQADPASSWSGMSTSLRQRLAKKLASEWTHRAIIALIVTDSVLILIDLSYTFLSESCKHPAEEGPHWLEVLSDISLAITILFMVELLLFIWAFGPKYYFHSFLHFVDGTIIITTFVIEVVLKGRERELAALLIMFRLIRFAAEAAVGVGEINEETVKKLEETERELVEKRTMLAAAEEEISMLKARLAEQGSA